MSKRTEEKFEKLLEQFMSDMECVDCPPQDFLEALKTAKDTLSDRYNNYEAEVEARSDEESES